MPLLEKQYEQTTHLTGLQLYHGEELKAKSSFSDKEKAD